MLGLWLERMNGVFQFQRRCSRGVARDANESGFARPQVLPGHGSVLALGVNDVGVGGVDVADEAVAAVKEEPVVVHRTDAAERVRRSAPTAVVLEAAIDAIGPAVVDADVVELADGQDVEVVPGRALVVSGVEAAIAADQHVAAVAWVDPEGVVVGVNGAGGGGGEADAAVGAPPELRIAEDEEDLVVVRIDADVREVEGPRVQAVDTGPGFHHRPWTCRLPPVW